jgi:ABC-type lipoprotein release transport system permease subunit
MNLYLRLAWRNIWRHRRRTLIVVLAIGLGMMLMMFYDGFVAGFEQAIYANAVKVLGGNIQVHADGYSAKVGQKPLMPLEGDQTIVQAALKQPQVQAASRRINTSGLATSREGAFSVNIIGIEPEQELPVNLVAQNVSAGRFLTAADEDFIYIGKGLAEVMQVGVGDRVTLVGRATHNQMRRHTMTIAGIYDIGMPEIEKRSVYMSLAEAQYLYDLSAQSTEVAISLHRMGEEPAVMQAMKPSLNGMEIASWETSFPEMEAAINSKSAVMDIFSFIIMMIAGIGILNLLLMAVYERTREIGLLGALGLKPRQISALFLLEGAMMGLVGLVFGIFLGLALLSLLQRIGFDYSSFSSMTEYTALISDRIYPTLGMERLAQRSLTVFIISLLAAYIPAREAASNEPAEALHYV